MQKNNLNECPYPQAITNKITGQISLYPCGKCNICRKKNSNEWAGRLFIESKSAKKTTFITLTYNEENLPISKTKLPTLKYIDIQLFMKKLRKKFKKLKYVIGMEYGEQKLRPHYHLILFLYENIIDTDLYFIIKELWNKGNINMKQATIGEMYYTINYIGQDNKYIDFLIRNKKIEPTGRKFSKGIGKISLNKMIEYYKDGTIYSSTPHRISRYYKNKIKDRYPKFYEKIWNQRYKEYIFEKIENNKCYTDAKKRKLYEIMLEEEAKRKQIKRLEDIL